MNMQVNRILNIFSILISPIFTILIVIKKIFILKKINEFKYLYPICFSIILIYLPLMPDMHSNLAKVFRKGYELNFYNIIQKFMLNNKISVIYFIMLSYFIILNIWVNLNLNILKKRKNFIKKNFKMCIFIIIFAITHRDIGDLNRFLLAFMIFCNAYLYTKNYFYKGVCDTFHN